MSNPERELLLLMAKVMMDDPRTCKTIGETILRWDDPRRRGFHSDQEAGWSVLADMVREVEDAATGKEQG